MEELNDMVSELAELRERIKQFRANIQEGVSITGYMPQDAIKFNMESVDKLANIICRLISVIR